jgi:4a-hydroxytetrahydrobiopterin dehydratase
VRRRLGGGAERRRIAERLFHHPEWSNVWSRVEIAITNHDAGGLTELDIEFCRRVDRLGGRSDG